MYPKLSLEHLNARIQNEIKSYDGLVSNVI